MNKEICNHGHDITNKLGIACPEGCLSNNQRGIENRQLVAEMNALKAELREMRIELSKCFEVAQFLDTLDPHAPGAFTGTVSERLTRYMQKVRS